MTVKELYEEAVSSGAEDYDIVLQSEDDGTHELGCIEYDELMHEITLS